MSTSKHQAPQTDIKCRFFAQYWMQYVKTSENHKKKGLNPLQINAHSLQYVDSDSFLELKSLSKISGEDALKGADLIGYGSRSLSEESVIFQFKKLFESPTFFVNQTNIPLAKMIKVFDFLRLKGYAVPFMKYSVEDLVSFGWVRLV